MRWPEWLGVGERRWKKGPDEEVRPAKTAWDWLQLLIVPAMLAAIAVAFNVAQTSRDRSREDRQIREDRALARAAREDATLESYFKQMSGLILDRHLLRAGSDSTVASVARTITLAAIRRLDGRRKGEVVNFLLQSGLLTTDERSKAIVTLVNLWDADLRGVDLRGASLDGIRLVGPDLRGAKFDRASLGDVLFEAANLRGASFRAARLFGATFESSDLTGVVFDDAALHSRLVTPESEASTKFSFSCLTNASFVGAYFNIVEFDGVEGRRVDFSEARFEGVEATNAPLADVRLD